MANFRTDQEKLTFLSARITRLQGSLERLEQLGLTSYSSAGNSKTFVDMEKLVLELARAEAEFKIVSDRLDGTPTDPMIKKVEVDFS